MLRRLYCLDRYTNKNIALETTRPLSDFKPNDKLVYQTKTDEKQSLAIYLWYEAPALVERAGELLDHLYEDDKKYFDEMQQKANEKFFLFKKRFKEEFPTAKPVTARYHIFTEQYYFYFFGEERYNFSDFVKRFREELGHSFFLFQIGARDMIKMSPATDSIIWCNGICLCCKSNRPLPNVEIEAVVEQHLEWRDIERLKGRCGKLKCCLLYEIELYLEENKKYPSKGEMVESSCGVCGTVISFNIMTGKVQIKDADGIVFSFDANEIKRKYHQEKK